MPAQRECAFLNESPEPAWNPFEREKKRREDNAPNKSEVKRHSVPPDSPRRTLMESNNPRSVCVSYSFDSLTLIPVDGGKWSYGLYHCPIVALTAACAAAGQATCADCGGKLTLT
jgi:hypothetical protein